MPAQAPPLLAIIAVLSGLFRKARSMAGTQAGPPPPPSVRADDPLQRIDPPLW